MNILTRKYGALRNFAYGYGTNGLNHPLKKRHFFELQLSMWNTSTATV